jgi:large-conductance mechanosensitive channel
MNNMAPIEFIILRVVIFFIIKEKIRAKEAKYPTHSENDIPKNIH